MRALDSVNAAKEDSCTNPTRTTAATKAIIVAARHEATKTRMILLLLGHYRFKLNRHSCESEIQSRRLVACPVTPAFTGVTEVFPSNQIVL
jgi:hypothetical protein